MSNLEIQFNAAIIKKVKSLNFQVDQVGSVLFILFCLYENRLDLLDEFDDYNRQRRAFLLYMELVNRGLLDQNTTQDDFTVPLFNLTKEGIEFVEYIKGEFAITHQEVSSDTIAIAGIDPEQLSKPVDENDLEVWIDEWVDIFPRGVKSGGRLLRGDKISCLRKMRVFMKEYPYTKDTILEATRQYIKSKEQEGYAYTRCAVYFIYRVDQSRSDKASDLATWCDQVLHEKSEGTKPSGENNLEIMA
jgi:hypothetical protein